METAENKYITVAYKLYAIEDGEKDFRNISSKLTVNSIANTSKKVTSYLCRLAMASV